jgi:hypothetical protein
MKITVDIPDKDLEDIMRFTGEKKKGPAIAKFVNSELMLRRRRELCDEVMEGKFLVDLPDWREQRKRDRANNPWNKS